MTQTCARPPQILRRKFCPTQLRRQTLSQRTNHLLEYLHPTRCRSWLTQRKTAPWSPDRRWSSNRERSGPNVHRV
jgi:hypothetical protein